LGVRNERGSRDKPLRVTTNQRPGNGNQGRKKGVKAGGGGEKRKRRADQTVSLNGKVCLKQHRS